MAHIEVWRDQTSDYSNPVWIVSKENGSSDTLSVSKTKSAAIKKARAAGRRFGLPVKIQAQSNPGRATKAQKRLNASKRSKQKRMTTALRKFLHQVNPAINTVAIHKLKGGVLKITPIKANKGRKR